MQKQFYRPEIDGLRALAVVPVVLYHLGVSALSGGYVGVDIFFVVSGYLITQIIMRHVDDTGGFSISLFYERRVRRIVPALAIVLVFTWLMAILLFLPGDLLQFSNSLVATVLFSSNVLFWQDSGYFEADNILKPLLHTWSLAVEEQFYIVYPLILLLLQRYWRKALFPFLWIGFIASFLLNAWGTFYVPNATFYLAPARAWELLLGALLAVNAIPRSSNQSVRIGLGFSGLLLISWAVSAFSPGAYFPALPALSASLGAAAIIHSSEGDSRGIGRLLSLKPVVAVGLISYSLYLWHWPLIVFTRYYLVRDLQTYEMVALLVASFALAIVSWRWVEQPFRQSGGVLRQKQLFKAAVAVGLGLIVLAVALHWQQGLRGRFLDSELRVFEEAKAREPRRWGCTDPSPRRVLAGKLCVVGERSAQKPAFLLWGDSHANAMIPGLEKEAQRAHAWGYFAYYTSCPPLVGVDNVWKSRWHECREFNDAMMKMALDLDIENVILAARWSAYPTGLIQTASSWHRGAGASRESFAQGLNTTIRSLSNSGRQIWIVEQAPWIGFDVPRALALRRKFSLRPGDMELAYKDHVARQQFVHGLFVDSLSIGNVHRIDPALMLCNEVSCQVEADGKSLYLDDDHLSEFGSQWISEVFKPVFGSVPATPKN